MKLREHRSTLAESMATTIEIEPAIEALENAIKDTLRDFLNLEPGSVHVSYYGYDDRINWSCHIVTIDGFGVYGFTDGPIKTNESKG
jgi:hypothetical protein